jgi:hypothetical protein
MADATSSRPRRVLARIDGVLRVLGAVVGALPVAVLLAGFLASYLPLSGAYTFPLAMLLLAPIWVGVMCACFLARRGWLVWVALAVAFVGLRFAVPGGSLF